ncbi:hypothetical protein AB1Y20_019413 [Prymnesium parvum]|uniref:Uncharacterized protein n=1 Tax=Prymnesium parvum TaxID=97485 RepID=A0AB34JRM0_PRYPA
MDLTDESREGGAIEGVPTNPSLVHDSIKSGPWFFGFENQWVAMQIAAAADGKLIVDTADSSLVCNLTTLKTSKDEGAHRLFEASGFWMELYVPKEHPPEEDASAESLFGQSTHPSEGVTPHGPRTGSATARKPEGKVKKMGWLTLE